ncbi:MAG: hypothetical protein MR387_05900 [Phocaeicola plebeius]|nr:hypothetical protein [Phocaeicola plebeius]
MFNTQLIQQNSLRVYHRMKEMYRYTFNELEKISALTSTELCLALLELQRQGRLAYGKDDNGVYYRRT